MSLALDMSSLFARETFHLISPDQYLPRDPFPGRPLNAAEDESVLNEFEKEDGNRIVYVNEVFVDGNQNQFRVIDLIGSGTYSNVFKCQLVSNPTEFYALKIIKQQPQYYQTGMNELAIMDHLRHCEEHPGKQHTMSFVSSFVDQHGHVCIVLPLYHHSLFDGLGRVTSVVATLERIRLIMEQLLQSLDFLHRNHLAHCDVKTDNIMFLNEDMKDIALVDFGSAKYRDLEQGQYIQSRFYRCPEVVLGLPCTTQIDIWSAGCVAAELFLDFAIFACENESDLICSMVAILGDFPPSLLASSRNWWKFFDYERSGMVLKSNVDEVMTQRHLNAAAFSLCGSYQLNALIMGKGADCPAEEKGYLASFSQFVYSLLQYDQKKRPTAEQALSFPFIKREAISPDWASPNQQQKAAPVAPVYSQPSPFRGISGISDSKLLSLF